MIDIFTFIVMGVLVGAIGFLAIMELLILINIYQPYSIQAIVVRQANVNEDGTNSP